MPSITIMVSSSNATMPCSQRGPHGAASHSWTQVRPPSWKVGTKSPADKQDTVVKAARRTGCRLDSPKKSTHHREGRPQYCCAHPQSQALRWTIQQTRKSDGQATLLARPGFPRWPRRCLHATRNVSEHNADKPAQHPDAAIQVVETPMHPSPLVMGCPSPQAMNALAGTGGSLAHSNSHGCGPMPNPPSLPRRHRITTANQYRIHAQDHVPVHIGDAAAQPGEKLELASRLRRSQSERAAAAAMLVPGTVILHTFATH